MSRPVFDNSSPARLVGRCSCPCDVGIGANQQGWSSIGALGLEQVWRVDRRGSLFADQDETGRALHDGEPTLDERDLGRARAHEAAFSALASVAQGGPGEAA